MIYPDLDGEALAVALASTYAPTSTYSYERARDTLFAAVHMEPADSLRGFYSGHAVWIDPALDPTAAAWSATPRYSTEHLWPENQGATEGTPAHKDMHHLAPVMQSVNSSRSDHPFAEVEDTEADRWWGPDGVTRTTAPPLATRDLYTEKRNGSNPILEPREDRAGDVARAMLYVWTVYGPSGADQLDAGFWAVQRDVLLDWHVQDPIDQGEIDRTLIIETHQGTANPFVLDATLAARAFGPPPVQVALASFTAEQAADGARIEWSTSAEVGHRSRSASTAAPTCSAPSGRPGARSPPRGSPRSTSWTCAALAVGAYRVGLTTIDDDDAELTMGDIGLTIEASTAGENDPGAGPFALTAPAPNPSRSRTTATLTVQRPVHVLAVVYDALGREARVAYDQLAGPGTGPGGRVDIQVDTTGLAPGVYILRVTVIGHGVAVDGSAAESRTFTVGR